MPGHKKPFYIPITTERNKIAIRELEPGITVVIDVINSEMPYDRSEANAWIEVGQEGDEASVIWFETIGSCERLKFGEVDRVRKLVEKAKTVV